MQRARTLKGTCMALQVVELAIDVKELCETEILLGVVCKKVSQ
jgi:hypothetical protein